MLKISKISIIAPNIKAGGGKELLEYLVDYLETYYKNLSVVIYLDATLNHIKGTNNREVILLGSTIDKIKLFTRKIDNSLYFGNLPPLRKSINSMVYFHNPYLLFDIKSFFLSSFHFFIKYSFQQLYIKMFIKNVQTVACQNSRIKNKFYNKYKFNNIEVIAFFRSCKREPLLHKKKYDFCYVSLAHPHKNHEMLLNSLEILSKKNISLKFALTIESDKIGLIKKINNINNFGVVEINNLGVLSKNEVCQLYAESKCLVFPSKEETFGLGLIEAVEMGLDVIASDLDYVYQVVEPSIVFNPNSSTCCASVLEKYMFSNDVKKSVGLVKNDIDRLIDIIIKESHV